MNETPAPFDPLHLAPLARRGRRQRSASAIPEWLYPLPRSRDLAFQELEIELIHELRYQGSDLKPERSETRTFAKGNAIGASIRLARASWPLPLHFGNCTEVWTRNAL